MIRDRNIANDAQIAGHKIAGTGFPQRTSTGTLYVDGSNGDNFNDGRSPDNAKKTIQSAVTAAGEGYTIYVFPKVHTDKTGDPVSYAETVIIPYTHSNLALIGVGRGRVQGGLPQIKKGSGAVSLLTIRAPGCLVANIGFNSSGSTGGCILLDDDYSAKAAFGTVITQCHFKNSVNGTGASSGGAINWSAQGNAWQVSITKCQFYRNCCDICILGTSSTVPQDVTIEDCIFSADAAIADCNIYDAGGDGFGGGLIINRCIFPKQPAKGTTDRFTDITCYGTAGTGILSNCVFGAAGTTADYGDGKNAAKIGTTIELCNNYSNAGLIVREA